MSDFVRRSIALPEGSVSVLDFGDPDRPVDVVFSHGNGFNAMCHRSALAPLADRLRILAVDQRGHGFTGLPLQPEGRTDWNDLGEDLSALLDALKLDRPVVLGAHSMGGVVSLMAAAKRPKLVKAVLAFDPVIANQMWDMNALPERLTSFVRSTLRRRRHFADKSEAMAAYRGRGAFATWPDAVLADYVEGGFKTLADGSLELACPPAWEASNYAAQGHDAKSLLLNCPAPVHILRAETGSPCRVELDGGGAHVVMETIVGSTHTLPMERPDLVQAALLRAVG